MSKLSSLNLNDSDTKRFWLKVDKKDQNNCWNWTACRDNHGYGNFRIGGRSGAAEKAHRVAAALSFEDFDAKSHYLHSCDNRSCCNPLHLRKGTHKENMKDMVDRNRNRSPRIGNGVIKIGIGLYPKIIELIESGKSKSEVARTFNVTPTRIRQIVNGVKNGKEI